MPAAAPSAPAPAHAPAHGHDHELGGGPSLEAAPGYFRTYEQVKTAMYALQTKYPDLVRVEDIGDSAEKVAGKANRDILALVLTNKSVSGDKPVSLHSGGIHAREIANPELLMTFATQLLEGFGVDADSTMILNSRETVLVPMLNPDGHVVVERGFNREPGGNTMQRKSTAAGDPRVGVDLNRNYDYKWGGAGASSNPGSETYRGPKAASEPETQAMQRYLAARKPQFYVDWHSHSKLNMYPWGDTRTPTKDHTGFVAIASKMTSMNKYRPMQAIDLYATTGTTMDYAYGVLGVPAMVVETGSSFHPSEREFAQTLSDNLPVLRYLTRAGDAPLARSQGPDATSVAVDQATRGLKATLSEATSGGQAIAGAELVLDPRAAPGSGLALQAADGKFDSPTEAVAGTLPAAQGPIDAVRGAMVYVRGRDASGNWGPLTAQWLTQPTPAR
jgi:hypothetical protein